MRPDIKITTANRHLLRFLGLTVTAIAVVSVGVALVVAPGADALPAVSVPGRQMNSSVPGRAMWLWNWTDNAGVISFARAHHVTEIFAYVAPGFTNPATIPPQWHTPEWPLISDLAVRARAAQIRVDALGGDPSWVPNPAVAVAWAAEVRASGLFGGVHLDIEPWQLPAWDADRAATIAQTVAVVTEVRARLGAVPLELSLPWWLYQYAAAGGMPLDVALMAHADSAAVITFFDDIGQIGSFGAREQADLASLGKPARLAVETNDVQPAWLTFAGTSQAVFTQTLDRVDAANAGRPGYLGVGVEDYTGWAALPV